ncbi:MAG TPA: crosslink repair DNA glycosylase YcaQ family protein, partial [Luteitalea sp.]|nr:crosslink repair DNA glycosylase YcaQ family protein [Luteitalea sp.]
MPRLVPRPPDVLTAVRQRLVAQGLTRRRWTRPEDVVSWFGAVQAQEYGPARWALGLRLEGVGDEAVAAAFDEGRLLRTHVLRPTWHFATQADLRWLLALTGPRIDRAMAPYDR